MKFREPRLTSLNAFSYDASLINIFYARFITIYYSIINAI